MAALLALVLAGCPAPAEPQAKAPATEAKATEAKAEAKATEASATTTNPPSPRTDGVPAAREPVPAELHGTWTARGDDPPWKLEYVLEARRYSMTGYPPIEEKGALALAARDGRRFHLVRHERTHESPVKDEMPDQAEWAELSEDGATLTMGGKTFRKQ